LFGPEEDGPAGRAERESERAGEDQRVEREPVVRERRDEGRLPGRVVGAGLGGGERQHRAVEGRGVPRVLREGEGPGGATEEEEAARGEEVRQSTGHGAVPDRGGVRAYEEAALVAVEG